MDVLESSFVEARLHTDGSENIERILALQELYVGDVGLPNYVIIDPSDESKHGRYSKGACVTAADADRFTEFLKKGLREIKAPVGQAAPETILEGYAPPASGAEEGDELSERELQPAGDPGKG